MTLSGGRLGGVQPLSERMRSQNTQSQERNGLPELPKVKPVKEFIAGRARGSIWKNHSQKIGTYYKVSIRRVEPDQDGNHYLANSFWPEDLGDVATVAQQCRIWLQEKTDAFEVKGSAATKRTGKRKPRPASSDAE
jgi:hypothetical protein